MAGKGAPAGLDPAGAQASARGFARALLGRDAATAASYFSPGGRILTADGTEVVGREGIAEVLAQIASAWTELEIRVGTTVVGEGVALCTQFWRRSAPGRDGDTFDSQTTARLVLVWRSEAWRIMIAAPWE